MSSQRTTLQRVRNPALPAQLSHEQRFWKSFANPQIIKENFPVTHIHFNPVAPHDFAVTSSTRIQVFSSKTRQVIRTFSRFNDTVFSGEYRHDGKLLVAADASGKVSIFDSYQPRSLLVSTSPSSYPTHVAKFHPTIGNHIITGSDDRTLRLYDISQILLGPVVEFNEEHGDYIRSCNFIPGNPHLVASGCYDGVVRIFDTRQKSVVVKFNHQNPVEDVLALTSTTLVSAGGPIVKVWDLARGLQIREFSNFSKAATTLHNTGDKGLLVGSLDGHVKIFDYASTNWDVKFGWKFESGGVLTTAVSPDFKHFATGLTNGLISIRTRKSAPEAEAKRKLTNATAIRNAAAREYKGEEDNQIVRSSKPNARKLKQFEKHLNAFRWSDALDAAVGQGLPKENTLLLLSELKKRGKIRVSLHGRDEISLMPILLWLTSTIDDTRSVNIVCDFLGVILEMYGSLIDQSVTLEEAFNKLAKRIDYELRKCKVANEISGMLELLAV